MTQQHKGTLLDRDIQQCPYQFYAQLRETAPVSYMSEIGAYYVARYDLARTVLIDSKRFAKRSVENDGRRFISPYKAAQELLKTKGLGLPMSMISLRDGQEHRILRGIVDKYFKIGAVLKMEDYVTSVVSELLDRIKGRTEIELISDFALPLPLYVIADMLGIPKSEYLTFKYWSDGITAYMAKTIPEPEALAAAEAIIDMHRYTVKEVEERRKAPREDLLTCLALAEYEGRPLTDREICGYMNELLVAGNETTTSALGAGFLYLARDQDLQTTLRSRPDLVPKFIDEVLRLESPLQLALRCTLVDVNLGGVDIPAGSNIFVSLASANRDEVAFAEPERIDLTREAGKPTFTFGAGAHHCLGAELSKLEQRVAYRTWLERYSKIELASQDDPIKYPESYAIRGPEVVRLRVHAAS